MRHLGLTVVVAIALVALVVLVVRLHFGARLGRGRAAATIAVDSVIDLVPPQHALAASPVSRVFVCKNFWSAARCQSFVDAAEKTFGTRSTTTGKDGWTTARHGAFPTRDIPMNVTPVWPYLRHEIETRVIPLAQRQFAAAFQCGAANTPTLRILDVFLVKYEGGAPMAALEFHRDGGEVSCNISLTEGSSFTGGGTAFSVDGSPRCVVRPKSAGTLVMHSARLFHSGVRTDTGTRYIMVIFMKSDSPLRSDTRESLMKMSRPARVSDTSVP
jgi:hypothetical protein